MRGWIITAIIFILLMVIGYLNKNNYQECVDEKVTQCENELGSNCLVRAKDFCNWVKK